MVSLACLISHVLKSISKRLFGLFHFWSDDVEQIGTSAGVMIFLLIFQSNLVEFDVNPRHFSLIEVFCLLIVALFHFFHTIVEPELIQVATQTLTTKRSSILRSFHHEQIYTCASISFLLVFSLSIVWRIGNISTWIFAVTILTIELFVRLISSIVQFTIYVLEAQQDVRNGHQTEKRLVKVKTITSFVEFLLGIFLLFNGISILLVESRNFLRAFILLIHAYLNIVKNLRRAFQYDRNQRSLTKFRQQFDLATKKQIDENNDVCSICFENFHIDSTLVTPCSHLFHDICLAKAFEKSDKCALCSRSIFLTK